MIGKIGWSGNCERLRAKRGLTFYCKHFSLSVRNSIKLRLDATWGGRGGGGRSEWVVLNCKLHPTLCLVDMRESIIIRSISNDAREFARRICRVSRSCGRFCGVKWLQKIFTTLHPSQVGDGSRRMVWFSVAWRSVIKLFSFNDKTGRKMRIWSSSSSSS